MKLGRAQLNQTIRVTFLVLSVWFVSVEVLAQEFGRVPAQVFRDRRTRLLERMDTLSVAVFTSAEPKVRSQDVNYRYRQESNFLYLTGLNEPGCFLLLVPSGVEVEGSLSKEILFVPARDNRRMAVTGSLPDMQTLRQTTACAVLPNDQFQTILSRSLPNVETLYYAPNLGFFHEPVMDKRYFVDRELKKELAAQYPSLKVKSLGATLAHLRQIKGEEELQLMQRAIDITCDALREAMKTAEPGMYEYELQAVIEYVFSRSGTRYTAFPSIIGSGPNSLILHYEENRRKMEKSDVVVMDVGAEYGGYAADVTRTIPVSGKFTEEQKTVYNIVLQAQRAGIAAIRPGVKFADVNVAVKGVIEAAGYGKFIRHGSTHYVGLDVHDVGDYATLEPGMVVTVEPGIYIPEGAEEVGKGYWNIGMRIEDDVLVTETGSKILSNGAPREIKEIERLMKL